MSNIEETKEQLKEIEILRQISSTLLEIGSLRIKTIRAEYERNQAFYEEVGNLYNLVKVNAARNKEEVEEFGKGKVLVAITSNKRFYGSLNTDIMNAFLTAGKLSKMDMIVIGHTGKRIVEDTYRGKCDFLIFEDDYPTPRETKMFLEKVKPYRNVLLYYPTFVNIFVQKPKVIDITHTPDEAAVKNDFIEYIFEPELPKLLAFFEIQIRRLLFMRIMLEAELSRIAARVVKMNTTEDNASEAIRVRKLAFKRALMAENDHRLLESISSIEAWKE